MMTLKDIRQYISGLGIAADSNVYIGKLDSKQDRSIGVYNRKADGPAQIALCGLSNTTYGIRPISLLIHWNRSVSDSEESENGHWYLQLPDWIHLIVFHKVYKLLLPNLKHSGSNVSKEKSDVFHR